MPGSFDLAGGQPPNTSMMAAPVVVAKYQPGSENAYTILPNVRCLRVDHREGPEPSAARFQYMMGDLLEGALGWPAQFEKLWPIDAQGDYVVNCDDRLVVLTQTAPSTSDKDPQLFVMFDGFAQIPQVDLAGGKQAVSFVALGTAIRLFDQPITGSWWRDASQTDTTDGSADVLTGHPCRFNPSNTSVGSQGGYMGNCVPPGQMSEASGGDGETFPVFLDPLCIERGGLVGGFDTSFWYVSDAIAYLIATDPIENDEGGAPFIIYPSLTTVKELLGCLAPPDDTGVINPQNAKPADIVIRDYDASNKARPEAMSELLRYAGFVMVYDTQTYTDGTPENHLRLVRRDGLATTAPKLLFLARNRSDSLDLAANNAAELHLAHDVNDLTNQWTVETSLTQHEVTVYLAPLFKPDPADVNNRQKFLKANLTNATDSKRRKYRWWGADECGDGHWDISGNQWVDKKPFDWFPVFPSDDADVVQYVDRYRPGSNTLISKDADGHPLKAVLQVMLGVASDDPGLATATNSDGWLTIPNGNGWSLLPDRLGIEITVNDPDEWTFAAINQPAGAKGTTKLRALTDVAKPSDNTNFLLRLTTVIESDQRIPAKDVTAPRRVACPTKFVRERSTDGKSHYQYCSIYKKSLYYATQSAGGDGSGDDYVARDDTKPARAHTNQLRAAHEFPTLAGSATIPYLTDYYHVGDRIKIIYGRGANLQINVGIDKGEAPTYPWITAISWDMAGDRQHTIIQFSDRRAEPQGV